LRAFLPVARRVWFNYGCAIGMAVEPIFVLANLRADPGAPPFVLTGIGLANRRPWRTGRLESVEGTLYDVMLAWDPDAMPADWDAGCRRYFTINCIQAVVTWPCLGCFSSL
jgi:hypothetical protein